MIDGLGHGEEAERAARAGEKAFALLPFASPLRVLEDVHQAMTGTRGGAVAIAQFDAGRDALKFVGIGTSAPAWSHRTGPVAWRPIPASSAGSFERRSPLTMLR